MNVILIGPQGSGKGTQANLLQEPLNIVKLSTGDLFRAEIAAGSTLGKQIQEIFNAGKLVSNVDTIELVRNRLAGISKTGANGALFDGFPRNEEQAIALDSLLAERGEQIDAVIELALAPEILGSRLEGRLVCRTCGATYHLEHQPPKVPGVCDVCGGVVAARDDDTPSAIRERLATYANSTRPLLDFYRNRGVLRTVNGDQGIEAVHADILAAIRAAEAD